MSLSTDTKPAVDDQRPSSRYGVPQSLIFLLTLAAGWITLQGVQSLNDIIAPTFFALNLMIAAYPIQRALRRRNVPAWIGSVISGLTVITILVAFFASLGWAVASLVETLPQYKDKFSTLYDNTLMWLSGFGIGTEQLQTGLKKIDPSSIMGFVQKAAAGLSSTVSLIVVIVTVLIFMMMDMSGFSQRLAIARDHNPSLVEALESFATGVRRYWVVSTVFGLIVALLDYAVLLALHVPLAGVWAVLSFVTNYIPNVGFVIGLIPPALMALLEGGPMAALAVVIAYALLNFVVQSVIQPKFAGDAVGVTATVSFLSLLFWAWVMGALGAILALPATLLVKAVMVDADPRNRWLNAFIAAKPATAGTPHRLRKSDILPNQD
ncbi:MAG: AI-2E family transporter [Propionibacteriaceae bacterium]